MNVLEFEGLSLSTASLVHHLNVHNIVACLEVLAAFLPEVSEPEHPGKVPGRPPADWLLGEVHRRPQVGLPIHNLPQPGLPEVRVQLGCPGPTGSLNKCIIETVFMMVLITKFSA